jgi:hypothetical protein
MLERIPGIGEYVFMAQTENDPGPVPSIEEIQKAWRELTLKVVQLDAELTAARQENKEARSQLERMIEHRQKSHAELITILTGLVAKLPLNDLGVIVSRLVEHNAQVAEVCGSLVKGKFEDDLLQPAILKAQEKTKRDLVTALQSAAGELARLDAPFEAGLIESLAKQPDSFFSPAVVRAARCYIKGQVPRERVVKEFGEEALVFFKDLTTDVKYNPRPKPEEIVLAFKNDFGELLQKHDEISPAKREALSDLNRKILKSRADTAEARAQRNVFLRLCFVLELLHYYDNQSTESPDVVFAQRLPPLIEQLVIASENDPLNERFIKEAEGLLAYIVKPDHRFSVINNMGKSGGVARTLRFVLAFRAGEFAQHDPTTTECVRHLIPAGIVPKPGSLAPILRLVGPKMQAVLVRAIIATDRIRRDDAEGLGKAIAKELGLKEVERHLVEKAALSPEKERQMAWNNIRELIAGRASPNDIAAAIRQRLHEKYDADEVKESWLTLTGTDAHSFIRVFCLLPYLPDGTADPVARPILETYIQRLMHEKYADAHAKVVSALRNMFKVKPDSPALLNFINLVRWLDAGAAVKLSKEIGLAGQNA